MQGLQKTDSYDALVVGGGIAGGEAALNLANNGFKVLIVEKDLSIGGKMILLSKVFPTLDCAACITTPKVSEISRHPGITIFTGSQVSGESVYVYFEAGGVGDISTLKIKNTILLSAFPKQLNLVNIAYKGQQKTLNFQRGKEVNEVSF